MTHTLDRENELLDTIVGLQDILVDRLEFTIPCEAPDCELHAMWALKCRLCGDATLYCIDHKAWIDTARDRLTEHLKPKYRCVICKRTAAHWADIRVWILLRNLGEA